MYIVTIQDQPNLVSILIEEQEIIVLRPSNILAQNSGTHCQHIFIHAKLEKTSENSVPFSLWAMLNLINLSHMGGQCDFLNNFKCFLVNLGSFTRLAFIDMFTTILYALYNMYLPPTYLDFFHWFQNFHV